MKSFLSIVLGALGGLAFCLGSIKLAETVGLKVVFPAFAGEEDFDLRFQAFFFGLLPAFLLFGGWVGHTFRRAGRGGWAMLLGAIVGTATQFALLMFMRQNLQELVSRRAANAAVIASFFSWILLAAATAWLAKRIANAKPR